MLNVLNLLIMLMFALQRVSCCCFWHYFKHKYANKACSSLFSLWVLIVFEEITSSLIKSAFISVACKLPLKATYSSYHLELVDQSCMKQDVSSCYPWHSLWTSWTTATFNLKDGECLLHVYVKANEDFFCSFRMWVPAISLWLVWLIAVSLACVCFFSFI